jgi:hypothetical protein
VVLRAARVRDEHENLLEAEVQLVWKEGLGNQSDIASSSSTPPEQISPRYQSSPCLTLILGLKKSSQHPATTETPQQLLWAFIGSFTPCFTCSLVCGFFLRVPLDRNLSCLGAVSDPFYLRITSIVRGLADEVYQDLRAPCELANSYASTGPRIQNYLLTMLSLASPIAFRNYAHKGIYDQDMSRVS